MGIGLWVAGSSELFIILAVLSPVNVHIAAMTYAYISLHITTSRVVQRPTSTSRHLKL